MHGLHAWGDVVAAERQRLLASLPVNPGGFPQVAGEEAVPGALEALGPQGPIEPPRRPPGPLQRPGHQPQQRHGRHRAGQRPRRCFPQHQQNAGRHWWRLGAMEERSRGRIRAYACVPMCECDCGEPWVKYCTDDGADADGPTEYVSMCVMDTSSFLELGVSASMKLIKSVKITHKLPQFSCDIGLLPRRQEI
jgi:hypothetical protein